MADQNVIVQPEETSINEQTAPIGATGDEASDLVTKNIVQEDDLAPEADQSREKTSNLPKAFSHAREFDNDGPPPGVADNEAPSGTVEALAEGAASNRGYGNFMKSLDEAKEAQEESGSTAI